MKEEDLSLKGKNKRLQIKKAEEAVPEEEALSQNEFEDIECQKCGAKKVISWMEQTRASDEPPTRFYKCLKCNHTWREYS
jgi:DNA-directed RNA polymerase subunit M